MILRERLLKYAGIILAWTPLVFSLSLLAGLLFKPTSKLGLLSSFLFILSGVMLALGITLWLLHFVFPNT
jgi:hypothetical protein